MLEGPLDVVGQPWGGWESPLLQPKETTKNNKKVTQTVDINNKGNESPPQGCHGHLFSRTGTDPN